VKSDRALFLTDTHPSKRFLAAISGLRSLVLLSATINPANLFLRSIGLDESSTVVHSAVTSYKFNIRTVIDKSVTTRFKMRTAEMYSRIALRVAAVCSSVTGGIGVFLPSYAVLGSVRDPLLSEIERGASAQRPMRKVLIERPGLTNEGSEEMMSTFKSNHGCVLLAVQGGRFSEGEDFPGDGMDASVVVGLSLAPPTPAMYAEYKQMETDRFDKHEAYMVLSLLPALRKAFQCAGRHVRNPGKVGMVFFMDSRFATQKIIDLMPSWLKEDLVKGEFGPDAICALTRDFFSGAPAH
jgi:DNA excision repair protein ERCC-2